MKTEDWFLLLAAGGGICGGIGAVMDSNWLAAFWAAMTVVWCLIAFQSQRNFRQLLDATRRWPL